MASDMFDAEQELLKITKMVAGVCFIAERILEKAEAVEADAGRDRHTRLDRLMWLQLIFEKSAEQKRIADYLRRTLDDKPR